MTSLQKGVQDVPRNRLLDQLSTPGFPDFETIFSLENLDAIDHLLEEFLQEKREWFHNICSMPMNQICFDDLDSEPYRFDYLFCSLQHRKEVMNDPKVVQVVDRFREAAVGYGNEVLGNVEYYQRLLACRAQGNLDREQIRVLDLDIQALERNGIHLDSEKKSRLEEIRLDMSRLSFRFSNNKLASEREFSYQFDSLETIREMPDEMLTVAAKNAEHDWKTWWLFRSDMDSFVSVMKYCSDRSIREHFYTSAVSRATSGEFDNRPIVLELLRLRKEFSELLGYRNYAEYSLSNKMADTPEQVLQMLSEIRQKATSKAQSELAEIREYFQISEMEAWDIQYYARILKERKYSVDEREVRKFFRYEATVDGMFRIASELYGLRFHSIDRKSYHPDVRLYEVYHGETLISYFLMDMFYRPEKRSGAWADVLRQKWGHEGNRFVPVVVNVGSFQKGEDGKILLTPQSVTTMFHEFGHALHAMLCQSKFPKLGAFLAEWDFVELPSQLMENWCSEPESLKRFAYHCDTGRVIPDDLLKKLDQLRTFLSGIWTLGQNEYWTMDMELHVSEPPETLEELDRKVIELARRVSPFPVHDWYAKHATFSHIFSGEYAAGYYGYVWAEILESDIFSRFTSAGIFDSNTGDRFLRTLLSRWTEKPASEMFLDFMGRAPDLEAYYLKRGFREVSEMLPSKVDSWD